MKFLLLATTLPVALLPAAAHADTVEASSLVSRVTVYADGAAVQRRASVDVPAGENIVVLRGLPAGLDPNSLRVEGQGSAALGIVSVDSRSVPGDARPTADPDLERRIDALKGDREGLAGAIEAAEGQKAAIQQYAQVSPERLSDAKFLDPEKWPLAWRTVGTGLADINETLRGLRERARLMDGDIAALERARPPAPRPGSPKRDVLITVTAATPLKADVTVSYQVSAASWTPVYDAKLTTTGDKPKLDLLRRASVQQRTGEDWTGVSLALSTVRLRRGTSAPELPTQVLTLIDPFAEAEAARTASMAARPVPPAAPMPKMQAETRSLETVTAQARVAAAPVLATLDAGAYAATFNIPDAVAVPADGTVKSFALGTRTIEPAVGARTAPAFDPTAFLEAGFTNDEEAPLLPGEVALVRDDAFIGKGRVALAAPGDKVRLGFGADDRIKVTRVPVARRDNDNGWGPNRSETQDFRNVVKNLHAFPVRITLIDRIPVSENTAVVVSPLDTNTPPTEKIVDDKRGVSGWTYDYKPGEQKEVRLGWRVRWPADRDLRRQ